MIRPNQARIARGSSKTIPLITLPCDLTFSAIECRQYSHFPTHLITQRYSSIREYTMEQYYPHGLSERDHSTFQPV
jgi:hypothetical protein